MLEPSCWILIIARMDAVSVLPTPRWKACHRSKQKNPGALAGSWGRFKISGRDKKGVSSGSKSVALHFGTFRRSSKGYCNCPALQQWQIPLGFEPSARGLFSTLEKDRERLPHFARKTQSPDTCKTAAWYLTPVLEITPSFRTPRASFVINLRISWKAASSLSIFGRTAVNMRWVWEFPE